MSGRTLVGTPDPDSRRPQPVVLTAITTTTTAAVSIQARSTTTWDRSYVSWLWAQDWDSPEDSVYDDL